MKTKHFLLVLSVISLSISAYASKQICEFPAVKKLTSGNLVSTYTFDYWSFARKNLDKVFSQKDLHETGPVVGDFHFNNVGLYFSDQTKKAELAIVDLDDAGNGSYLGDYLKFLSYLKTIDKKLDQKKLLKNYIAGLASDTYRSGDVRTPKIIAELLKKNKAWFDEKNKKAVIKNLNGKKTAFGKNEDLKDISSLSSDINRLIEKLKPELQVLDTGYKVNESGSSMGSLRVLVLGQDKQCLNIYEFKELRCPGLEKFYSQNDQIGRFEDMKQALKSDDFWGQSFIAASLDRSGKKEMYFLFRKKQENALQDLEIDKMKNKDLSEYADYYAYLLGYFHGKSASKTYVDVISNRNDFEKLEKKSDQFSEAYLDHLKNKIK